MTTEELLKPRYKVIADYPFMQWALGQIILLTTGNDGDYYFEKFPHLFKKLEWWEERKPEDMPEYVKSELGVFKAEWKMSALTMFVRDRNDPDDIWIMPSEKITPATEQEYQRFINPPI